MPCVSGCPTTLVYVRLLDDVFFKAVDQRRGQHVLHARARRRELGFGLDKHYSEVRVHHQRVLVVFEGNAARVPRRAVERKALVKKVVERGVDALEVLEHYQSPFGRVHLYFFESRGAKGFGQLV